MANLFMHDQFRLCSIGKGVIKQQREKNHNMSPKNSMENNKI